MTLIRSDNADIVFNSLAGLHRGAIVTRKDEIVDPLTLLAKQVGDRLNARDWRLATAESCTGGWIAKCVTDIAGSSRWFDRGFVTYANEAKVEMLGVSADTLAHHGAVSEATVREMVFGALQRSHADLAVAVSGIAGPGGGSADKPVGLVWFAFAKRDLSVRAVAHRFDGDREAVRYAAVEVALQGLLELVAA